MGIVVNCVLLLALVAVGYAEGTNSTNTTASKDGTQYTLSQSVEPYYGVAVGEVARLRCFLQYENQTTSRLIKFYMLIGTNEIYDATSEDKLLDADSNLYRRTITGNRTIEAYDKGKDFKCQVISTTMNFSVAESLEFRSPTTNVTINWKTNNKNNTCCLTNDILNCSADGYPTPYITWRDEKGVIIQPVKQGSGYSYVRVTKEGIYTWNCSANNQFSPQPVSVGVLVKNGESASGVVHIIPSGFHILLSLLYIGLTLLSVQ